MQVSEQQSINSQSIKQTPAETLASKILWLLFLFSAFYCVYIQKNQIHEQGLFYPLQIIPPYQNYFNGVEDYYRRYPIEELTVITQKGQQMSLREKNNYTVTNYEEQVLLSTISSNKQEQYEWIQWEDPNGLIENYQLSEQAILVAKAAKTGLTLLWSKKSQFVSQWVVNRDRILKGFKEAGLFYNEILSLNLRAPTGKLLALFTTAQPKTTGKTHPRNPTPNYLSIHNVFRMTENLAYLREWIGYHINLGVDKFFLYDNIGTVGNLKTAIRSQTKKGVHFECFGFDEQKDKETFDQLWRDYYEHIIYVAWQPTLKNGEIFYGHIESLHHYKYYFEDATEFTSETDCDQYLFSPDNYDLIEYIKGHSYAGATSVKVRQAKFGNRFCYDHKRMIEITEFYPARTIRWAPKNILNNRAYKVGKSIHYIKHAFGYQYYAPEHELRFNHYNLFKTEYNFSMEHGYSTNQTRVTTDDSMSRYYQVMQQICDGQCTENFQFQCERKNYLCPVVGRTMSEKASQE